MLNVKISIIYKKKNRKVREKWKGGGVDDCAVIEAGQK